MYVQYEYLHNLLFVQGFEDNVHHFLKGKHLVNYLFVQKKLKKIYLIGMEPNQWERLVKYWTNEKTIIKARSTCVAQRNQRMPSKYGRGGEAFA
jgi:hypothetical protein